MGRAASRIESLSACFYNATSFGYKFCFDFGTALSHMRITSDLTKKRKELLVADHQQLRTLFWPVAQTLQWEFRNEKTF